MTVGRPSPEADPEEWLNRARGDLALARMTGPGIYREDLCFHLQQAAEKAVKAVCVKHGLKFPYVHDIADILRLLERNGHQVSTVAWEGDRLTRFAFQTRYPNPSESPTDEAYREYLRIAEALVRWAEAEVAGPSGGQDEG